ncbi:glutathione S-transferase N-terminal domain-containing protein [Undibacterium sp. TJN25]|uniref:glutathione S-transferase N-terminal domain-containing protein n=1 Tax=Undibacterium sp. TJN25 TaxID=3413056 RepID=UPI003BF0EF66
MKLYYMPGACSLADLIVLEWAGTPYQAVQMDLDSMKEAGYLSINAGGTVPLLQHGDFTLTENVAILGYLADLSPDAQLLGDGTPRARAEVMRWLGFLNSDVHKAFKPIFTPGRFLEDETLVETLAANARLHIRKYLERLDAQLAGRDWIAGQRSIADPYLYVVARWAIGKEVNLQGLHQLSRFVGRMNTDAGVRAALAAEGSPILPFPSFLQFTPKSPETGALAVSS